MKKYRKPLGAFLFMLIAFSWLSLFLPEEALAEGCAFSCKEGSASANTYCAGLYGGGGTVGTTFSSTGGAVDCLPSEKPACSLNQAAICCCAAKGSLVTPTKPVAQATAVSKEPKFKIPELQVSIPGLKFGEVSCANRADGTFLCSVSWIGDYIAGIYQYGLGVGGILAAVMLMAGGAIWLVSGGDASRVSTAKNLITGSVTGLIILFASYMILYQINPDLTELNPIAIGTIKNLDNEPESSEGNESGSTFCNDCATITGVPVKEGMGKLMNKNLLAKLQALYAATSKDIPWRITEAYPPSQKHKSKCHNNGMCADIAIIQGNNTCGNVAKFEAALANAGLSDVLNEYTDCGGQKTTYTSGGHFHVR